jgi:hypothetical protein
VRLQQNVEGEYQVQAVIYDDTQTPMESSWYALTDEAHFVEVEWWAAEEGGNNGSLGLHLDDEFMGDLFDIDNDSLRVDYAELGVLSPTASTITGTLYFDDFVASREGHLGPGGLQMRLESESLAPAMKQDEPQDAPNPTATPTPTSEVVPWMPSPATTGTPAATSTPTPPAQGMGSAVPPQADVPEVSARVIVWKSSWSGRRQRNGRSAGTP